MFQAGRCFKQGEGQRRNTAHLYAITQQKQLSRVSVKNKRHTHNAVCQTSPHHTKPQAKPNQTKLIQKRRRVTNTNKNVPYPSPPPVPLQYKKNSRADRSRRGRSRASASRRRWWVKDHQIPHLQKWSSNNASTCQGNEMRARLCFTLRNIRHPKAHAVYVSRAPQRLRHDRGY